MIGTPVVAIWCNEWLPASQTFIRDQVSALTRYEPTRIGLRAHPDELVSADYAPLNGRFAGAVGIRRIAAGFPPPGYRRHLLQTRARLVHSHFGPDSILAAEVAKSANLPLISTFHGYDVTSHVHPTNPHSSQYRRRLERVFKMAAVLIAVSDYIADQLLVLGAPKEKVRVHHIGIPLREPTAAVVGRQGITFVGRFVEKKGASDLLKALALLPEPARSTPVSLVGYGPLDRALRAEASDLRLNARFLGQCTSQEIANLLASSEIFCAPSLTSANGDSEGFGMVFLEAAYQSLPVLSYRHGGIPEAVLDGETGLLVDEGDVAGLAAALGRLLAEPATAQAMGSRGRARVIEDFDIRLRTEELESLYDEAIGSGVTGPTY